MMGFLSQVSCMYPLPCRVSNPGGTAHVWRWASSERSGAVEGLRAQMWAESRLHCFSSRHSPRVASYEQAFGAGDIITAKLPHLQHHPCSPPLPAPSGHMAWMQVHPSGEAPPSNSPLHPTPSQLSSGVPNAGQGKKGHSCLSAEFPAEGVPGGVDPVRPLPRGPPPGELRSQGK